MDNSQELQDSPTGDGASPTLSARDSHDSHESEGPILYKNESQSLRDDLNSQELPSRTFTRGKSYKAPETVNESYVCEEDTQQYHLIEKPSEQDVMEILSLLKVKTSALALGACDRIKRLARAHPVDVIRSPILPELLHILVDGPATPLAGGAISALVTLALIPEGRKHIMLLGGSTPIVRLLGRCDLNNSNTSKALQLLMNLAADSGNRRILREAHAVEVVVQLMNKCPLGPLLAHAMGALHNIMLTDSKAKQRAVEAGVVTALARVLASKQEEGALLGVRAHMLISDLLRVEDMQVRLISAAQALGLYIPGLMPPPKERKNKPSKPTPETSVDGGIGEGSDQDEHGSMRSSVVTPSQGEMPEEYQQQEGQPDAEDKQEEGQPALPA